MSIFKYTLPSGSEFAMTAPTGTTQLEADLIFYSQVAAGAFVGYSVGQTLTAAESVITKFALSRLDRGTAGVDTAAVIAVVNSIPTVSGIPSLIATPLTNPITQADIANIDSGGVDVSLPPEPVGPLGSDQVRGILAQIANLVDQPADVMSDEKGVGQFGLTVPQLEQAGLVKPGTWQRFIFDPAPLTAVLSSPGIWTGRGGINAAQDFLGSVAAQNKTQVSLMQNAYQGLLGTGAIAKPSVPSILASQGQIFTQSGLQGISSLGILTNTSLSVPSAVSSALSGTPIASLLSSATTNLSTIGSGAIGSAIALPSIAGLTRSLTNTATGDIGALVANASRFGTDAATAWAAGSSGVIGSITSSVNSLVGGAGTSISSLTSSLDITGKASQFATAFSTPLSNLSNLGNFDTAGITGLADKLTGSVSGLADKLTGAVTSSVTALTDNLGALGDKLTGSLSNLSNLADLGSLGKLGGLFGGGGDALVSPTQIAAGFSNTVDRATVDVAVVKILGSSKIPVPTFEYPSLNSLSLEAGLDIASAQKTLQNLKSQGSALLGSASQLSSLATTAQATLATNARAATGVISNALTRSIQG